MKQLITRFSLLITAALISPFISAHPGHEHMANVDPYTHHFSGISIPGTIAVLVLLAGFWGFGRRR